MKAEQLRKSILQLAIQGKLVPQDPADEPASVLLERIRAEKQSLIKQGKIKKDKGDSVIFKGDDNCYYEKTGSEVKNITDEIPFDIPDSWCWTRLGNLITIISGVSYDKKDVCNNGIRILRGGNVNDLKITTFPEDVFLPEKYHDTDKQIRKNDIIVVASTGSKTVIGKAGYVDVDVFNTQIGAFLRIVRPLLGIIAPYLKLIFATEYYREHIRTQSQGTNINNVKAEYITEFRIPFPPLAEQERIVAEIEKFEPLIAEYDKLEQQATKLDGEIYDKLKKSILQHAIQGKLVPQNSNDEPASVLLERIRAEKKAQLGKKYVDSYIYKGDDNCYYEKVGKNESVLLENLPFDIPDSWCWARLKEIVTNHGQKIPDKTFSYIDIGSIDNKMQRLNSVENFVSPQNAPSRARKIVEYGDILYATVRPYLHNMAIIDKTFSHEPIASTGFAVLSCKNGVSNKYLFFYLLSPIFDLYANSNENAKGVAYPAINDEKLYNALIAIPPYNEQIRICNQIEMVLDKY